MVGMKILNGWRSVWCMLALIVCMGRLWAEPDLQRSVWNVGGVEREALVYLPATMPAGGAPLVFVFHGHTGTMRHAARSFALHESWPEAIVVYPQGLPTPSRLKDPEGKYSGWQGAVGEQSDRDLKLFDTMLADFSERGLVNRRRVYAMGHSNGGLFTYVLWAARGDRLAAVAPSAALLPRGARSLEPKPAFIAASPTDTLVKYAWQERMINVVLRLNGCTSPPAPWSGELRLSGRDGNDVTLFIHDGGHGYPQAATSLIAAFFQAHPKAP